MSLVYSEIGGITVASRSADERSVRQALKAIDGRYMLDDPSGTGRWLVLCYISPDQPPWVVTTWNDEYDRPLPLSHGLVEKVKRLRIDGRGVHIDPEVENAKLVAKRQADFEEQIDDAARYRMKHRGQWRYFFGDSRLDPLAIRAARAKARH